MNITKVHASGTYREWLNGPDDGTLVWGIFAATSCSFKLGWISICRYGDDYLYIISCGPSLELTLSLQDKVKFINTIEKNIPISQTLRYKTNLLVIKQAMLYIETVWP